MARRCNICQEWERHLYWNIPKATKFQFWSPLRGNFAEEFRIPGKFVKNFKEKLGVVIHLTSPTGKTWRVKLKNINGDMFFVDGWKKFAGENLLEEHDLLVFKYEGDSHFTVSIFDKSGCEKESAYFIKKCNHHDIPTENENDVNASEDSIAVLPTPTLEIHECSSTGLPHRGGETERGQPSHVGSRKRRTGVEKYQESYLCATSDNHSFSSNNGCGRKQCHKKQKARAKSDGSFSKSVDESRGNPLSSNPEESHEGNVKDERCALAKSSYSSFLLSERRPVTEGEIEQASKRATKFQSDNPFFGTTMKATHVYRGFFMAIPKQFAAEHLPPKKATVTLRTPHSKVNWFVNYRHIKCSSGFSGNWRKFVHDNHLEEGDVCVFELKENSKDVIMDVHFFRVVELELVAPCARHLSRFRK